MPSTPKPSKKQQPAKETRVTKVFPIVAIGASAGGLEAMTELLKYLEPDTGMAFIYVQHLSPDHKSMLTMLLAKTTSLKVQEVKNKMLIAPNNLYVIPPDKEMTVGKGHISISPRPDSPRINLPIDILFCSVAAAYKENAIGIILSGSASDGTRGMKCIKNEGGLTFAQDESAKFNSMPFSAISAGVVDYTLSPKGIALELDRLSKHPFMQKKVLKDGYEEIIDDQDPELKAFLNLLQSSAKVDFRAYKMRTFKRRIIRRMLLYKIKDLQEYVKLISNNREELDILYQDLLINVTSFFRDSETNKYLKTTLLPKLLKNTEPGKKLRIWVPACSTGEEAYSIAMMLVEIQTAKNTQVPVQIFATDLSQKAIKTARIGIYTTPQLDTVTPRRLQRFFTKSNGGYRIGKPVRDMCVFAPHNILTDPPFSRIDFISCRNLFIYLEPQAQKRGLASFHYGLNENGHLMLGKSEAVTGSKHLFTPINNKFKVFIRKSTPNRNIIPELTYSPPQITMKQDNKPSNPNPNKEVKSLTSTKGLDSAIDAVLVSNFIPASVVINHQLDVIQFRGNTDLYLTHTAGKATFQILKLVRPEIVFALRNAIAEAIKQKHRVKKTGILVMLNNTRHFICIDVLPIDIDLEEPLLLVVFTEMEQVEPYTHKEGKDTPEKDSRIRQLEEELKGAHEDALTYSNEQEAMIEELQSANEEVVSSNEELQTVNEELETSKEEIESTNEELITTNQELQTRNDLLNESYNYTSAVISTLFEPLLVLDRHLRIKTASKSFFDKFGGTEEDAVGVLLYDFGNKQWNIPRLRKLLEEIIPKKTQFKNFEVNHTFPGLGQRNLILNASLLDQKSHGEQLILLSINDVTAAMKLVQLERDAMKKEAAANKARNILLEKAVKEGTRELKEANSELAEKYEELLRANKELETFTYVASHDLQEPLRKIQLFSGRLLETEEKKLSEPGKDYFKRMRSSAEQMQMLIENLLAFSQINTGDREFKSSDLDPLLNEVLADLHELIEEKNATIEVGEMCSLRIIRFQFKQLLYNLLNNAVKFSREGVDPHIVITCRKVKSAKGTGIKLQPKTTYCRITISDNGIGFEKEFNEKIFEVFEKLHGNSEYAGTGIGLAIVKQIVDNHNGFISVNSELKKGTTFNIYIPANNE